MKDQFFLSDEELEQASSADSDNPYLSDNAKALKLLLALVNANTSVKTSDAEKVFQNLERDLKEKLLGAESAYPKAAAEGMVIDYQLDRLREVIGEKGLVHRQTVAIGGAFSTGKSAFLNSLIGVGSLLPVALKATTAIPTWLLLGDPSGQQEAIYAENAFGDRALIDRDALQAICHELHERHGVVLNRVVRRIHVEVPTFPFRNLAMIDTPGYSKADLPTGKASGSHKSDEEVAREQLVSASHVFWMADVERGHLSGTDVEFLQSLGESKPVTVIFNKADLKPRSECEKILAAARQVLDARKINYGQRLYLFSSIDPAISQKTEIEQVLKELDQERVVVDWALPVLDALQRFANFYTTAAQTARERFTIVKRALFVEAPEDQRVADVLKGLEKECKDNAETYEKRAIAVTELRKSTMLQYQQLGTKLGLTFSMQQPRRADVDFPGDIAFEKAYGRILSRKVHGSGVIYEYWENKSGSVKAVLFGGESQAEEPARTPALLTSSASQVQAALGQKQPQPLPTADFFHSLGELKKKR